MENGKYRILHLRKEFERNLPLFINYVRGVDNSRFSHIICYLGKDRGLRNVLSDMGYEIIYLGFGKSFFEVFNPLVLLKVVWILREKKIDILHCHKHKPTIYGTMASLLCSGVHVISHIHGLARTRSLKRRVTNWIVLRHAERIIAVSDSVRQDVIRSNWGIDPERVVTVRNCIDLKSIDSIKISKSDARLKLGIGDNEFVFGTVGRLAHTKGQIYLIDAFSQIAQKVPHAKLVIIGDGPLNGDLKQQVAGLGISHKVLFTGYRNDVLELLRGFDVFILPSLAEGLSIALLEAMASKLPVVASRVGGIPEVFGQSECGKLVPPKDASVLASAMLEMSSLEYKTKKYLGENGRKRIEEEFTVDIMVKNLTEVYNSVISGER